MSIGHNMLLLDLGVDITEDVEPVLYERDGRVYLEVDNVTTVVRGTAQAMEAFARRLLVASSNMTNGGAR